MASPPPSGPTQPPYQPYPQQPYPPQYPPQPYYAPAAPPPRPDHTVLYIVVAVVAVIVIIGLIGLFMFLTAMNTANQATRITVTGVRFTISYNGVTTGYFGGNQITTCPTCPFTVSLFQRFDYVLTLHNNDPIASHSVDNIDITGSFALVSVSPTLPATVASGTSIDFTLNVQPATLAGTYTLTGTVSTT